MICNTRLLHAGGMREATTEADAQTGKSRAFHACMEMTEFGCRKT